MFTFGFYNSKSGDRKYNATHMGKIFDGVIQEGVFGTIHETDMNPFALTPTGSYPDTLSLTCRIHRGKAWLAHTWNLLDSISNITFDDAQPNYKRTDAVCLEVNNSYTAEGFNPRTNRIVIVKGSAVSINSEDSKPSLTEWQQKNSAGDYIIWRFPLAYVTIYGTDKTTGTNTYHAHTIEAINIQTAINPTSALAADKYATWTPLVTGATMDASDYIPSQEEFEAAFNNMLQTSQAEFNTWFDNMHNTIIIDPSAQASLTQLNSKIDNKIIYGVSDPPSSLLPGQVYFQIED